MGKGVMFCRELRQIANLVLLAVATAVATGICLDTMTTTICLEYFTKGFHYEMAKKTDLGKWVLNSNSKLAHIFHWGVLASWWVGAILSIPLVLSCRLFGQRRYSAKNVAGAASLLVAVVLFLAMIAGLLAWFLAKDEGVLELCEDLGYSPPSNVMARRYFVCLSMHQVVYGSGALLGACLCILIIVRRAMDKETVLPTWTAQKTA